ncbi:MAG TPA: putative zinc-binding metallopeptidase [Steroidobacteraceae bacterium]|nr:putative zinc-binding metallopeptidase [Steroidobacteraceae bacterium]
MKRASTRASRGGRKRASAHSRRRRRKRASTQSIRRKRAAHWSRLSDEHLLDLRFRDLKLRIEGTELAAHIERLYGELEAVGLKVKPHCWLAEEWFSPDGVPGIAIPFYLSHPRLRQLERRMMHEVEGGNSNWMMRILRHEAGHAVDTAFRLRRRRRWREVFGPASLPYPDSYRPRPGSRRFVQHLGAWYAQSHPTEDFAETFAVWLRPRSGWRRSYQGWRALEKLRFVDELMRELAHSKPPVRTRDVIEPLSCENRTLRQHYRSKLARYTGGRRSNAETLIGRALCADPQARGSIRAAAFVRALKPDVRRRVARKLDTSEYLIHQVLRLIIHRSAQQGLAVHGPARAARRRIEALVTRIARLHLNGAAGRHVL